MQQVKAKTVAQENHQLLISRILMKLLHDFKSVSIQNPEAVLYVVIGDIHLQISAQSTFDSVYLDYYQKLKEHRHKNLFLIQFIEELIHYRYMHSKEQHSTFKGIFNGIELDVTPDTTEQELQHIFMEKIKSLEDH